MIVDIKPAAPEEVQNSNGFEGGQPTSASALRSQSGPSHQSFAQPSVALRAADTSPPEYDYPASRNCIPTIAPVPASYFRTPSSPITPPEHEWETTLRDLQRNLSDLDAARQSRGRRSHNLVARLIHVLFSTSSFLDADSGLGREADLEWQESSNRVRVQEELVLMGMRKLSRLHPSKTERRLWYTRANKVEHTMKTNAEVQTSWTYMPVVIMSEKLGVLRRRQESALEGLMKGFLILFLVPFAGLYGSIYLMGALLFAMRRILFGFVHVFTFGRFM